MKSVITYEDSRILTCIRPEQEGLQHKRSDCKIEQKGDKVIFTIDAKDSTALKATEHSVNTLISVFEKTKKLTENERKGKFRK